MREIETHEIHWEREKISGIVIEREFTLRESFVERPN